jgi:hypothetical protein
MPGFSDSVMYADNVRFDGADYPGQVTLDGQLIIGSTVAPNLRIGLLGAGTNIAVTNGAGTVSIATIADPIFDTVTINNPPTLNAHAATKAYVDAIAAGLTFKSTVLATTTAALNATYANGVLGVGATLTNAGALGAFSTDGQFPALTQRILVKDQVNTFENGIYTVTVVGDGATPWVLTRAVDYDTAAEMPIGSVIPVQTGTAEANTLWLQNTIVTTIGVDAISYQEFQSPPITTTQHAVLIGALYDRVANVGPLTNGQLVIGSTGVAPVAATLTAGVGVAITNGAGSIQISCAGTGTTWSVIAADQPAVAGNGYFCNKAGTLALTLPAASVVGDTIEVANINVAAGIQFIQAAGQQIYIGNQSTTLGVGGTLTSTAVGDSLKVVCMAVNTLWQVVSSMGSWTVV